MESVWTESERRFRCLISVPCLSDRLKYLSLYYYGFKYLSLCGLMAAASPVLPLGLSTPMKELRLHPTVLATRLIRVSRSCCRHLLMWRDPVFLQSGVRMGAIHRRHMITTDASMTGWGAVFEGRPASGEWKEEFLFWHINCLELRAVFLALKYFLPFLRGYHSQDGQYDGCVPHKPPRRFKVAHPGQACAPSSPLVPRQIPLFEGGSRSGSTEPGGRFSVETEAQTGRMDVEPSDRPDLGSVWQSGGEPLCFSRVIPVPALFSLSFPTTLGIDAFAHPWPNVSLYAFPPIKLIPAVLCRVKVSGALLLLIALFWPSQTWFSELTPLLYRPPWEIPIRRDLLSQLQGKIWHPQPELWKLWVWPIQGQGLWLIVCLPKFRKP